MAKITLKLLPVFHARYVLDGNLPDAEPGDVVELIEFGGSGSQLSNHGNSSYTWTFTNGMQPIHMVEIESTFANDGTSSFRVPDSVNRSQTLLSRSSETTSHESPLFKHAVIDHAFTSLEQVFDF